MLPLTCLALCAKRMVSTIAFYNTSRNDLNARPSKVFSNLEYCLPSCHVDLPDNNNILTPQSPKHNPNQVEAVLGHLARGWAGAQGRYDY